METKKFLIGTVTCDKYEYCLNEFLAAVEGLSCTNHTLVIIDNSRDDAYSKKLKEKGLSVIKLPHHDEVREMLVEGHNYLRELALKDSYDYLLILDQDVIVPFNLLKRLLSQGKEIITGLYYNIFSINFHSAEGIVKKNALMPVLFKEGSEEGKVMQFSVEEVREPKLIEARQCGTGCLLLAREVLENITFRHVEGNKNFDDTWFCTDARKEGYRIYCDTSMKCMHRILDKEIPKEVWDGDIIVKDSIINGKGVFANKDFKKSEIVLKWDTRTTLSREEVEKLSEEGKKYISYIDGKFILMKEPERFVNHSCENNTSIKGYCDVAIRDIKKGEEITSDYSEALIPGDAMECKCGSRKCRHLVFGK